MTDKKFSEPDRPEPDSDVSRPPEALQTESEDDGVAWHVVVGILIAAVAAAYLIMDGLESETYFFEVDEAVARGDSLTGEEMRVKGTVVPGSIIGEEGKLGRTFHISQNGKTMRVTYAKAVPDTFKEDVQVVANGTLRQDGTLEADEVLVKCPSRYEGAPPTAHDKANSPQAKR